MVGDGELAWECAAIYDIAVAGTDFSYVCWIILDNEKGSGKCLRKENSMQNVSLLCNHMKPYRQRS